MARKEGVCNECFMARKEGVCNECPPLNHHFQGRAKMGMTFLEADPKVILRSASF